MGLSVFVRAMALEAARRREIKAVQALTIRASMTQPVS